MRALKVGSTLAALMAASLLIAAAPAKPPQDLHGTWQLNEDLTARMRESERQQEGNGHPRFGSGGMGRRGGPGGTPGGGFDVPPETRRGPEPTLETLAEITIEQTADKVTFKDAAGQQRTFTTDNKKVRNDQLPGGPADVRAKWDETGSLVIDVMPDKGPRRFETWVVSNDRKLLYLTVEMQGGTRPGFKIRRAYNAAVSGAAPGEPKKPEPPPN